MTEWLGSRHVLCFFIHPMNDLAVATWVVTAKIEQSGISTCFSSKPLKIPATQYLLPRISWMQSYRALSFEYVDLESLATNELAVLLAVYCLEVRVRIALSNCYSWRAVLGFSWLNDSNFFMNRQFCPMWPICIIKRTTISGKMVSKAGTGHLPLCWG